jgi:hypothetical protein
MESRVLWSESIIDSSDAPQPVAAAGLPARMADRVGCLEVSQRFVDAGFDRLALMNSCFDVGGCFRFFESELSYAVRKLMSSGLP